MQCVSLDIETAKVRQHLALAKRAHLRALSYGISETQSYRSFRSRYANYTMLFCFPRVFKATKGGLKQRRLRSNALYCLSSLLHLTEFLRGILRL